MDTRVAPETGRMRLAALAGGADAINSVVAELKSVPTPGYELAFADDPAYRFSNGMGTSAAEQWNKQRYFLARLYGFKALFGGIGAALTMASTFSHAAPLLGRIAKGKALQGAAEAVGARYGNHWCPHPVHVRWSLDQPGNFRDPGRHLDAAG